MIAVTVALARLAAIALVVIALVQRLASGRSYSRVAGASIPVFSASVLDVAALLNSAATLPLFVGSSGTIRPVLARSVNRVSRGPKLALACVAVLLVPAAVAFLSPTSRAVLGPAVVGMVGQSDREARAGLTPGVIGQFDGVAKELRCADRQLRSIAPPGSAVVVHAERNLVQRFRVMTYGRYRLVSIGPNVRARGVITISVQRNGTACPTVRARPGT